MSDSLVPGAMNFRDIGGLPAGSGVTRSGVLYRSGNLARLRPDGIRAVRGLGVRHIVDLRSGDEVEREPNAEMSIPTQRVPLFLGSVASFFDADMTLADMYDGLVDDASDRVVTVVRAVIEQHPLLVHCTVGKDRTGVTVALTLAAAGVDEEAVIADYARTEGLLPAERNAQVLAILRAMHPTARNVAELATRSPAPVMRGLLGRLNTEHGSVGGYLREHGLTSDELGRLRSVIVGPR